jgi:protein-disulfide isomerase
VALCRRSIITFLLVCLGCSAQQSANSDLNRRIERQVRSYYNIPSSVKVVVGPVRPSEFPNYDAITITFDGGEKKQVYDFLLSKDNHTLARFTKLDLTKDPYLETMKKIDLAGRPVRGDKDAKVVVVSYDDFQCPYCSRMHETMFPEILREYGDRVAFVYKDYPLAEIHPWSIHAAVNANCLGAQSGEAYWAFADFVHANQRQINSQKGSEAQFSELDRITLDQGQKQNLDAAKLQACVKAQDDSAIKVSIKEAEALGVDGTPALFINGQKIGGAIPAGELRATLDLALEDAGVPTPARTAGAGQAAPSLTK